jgi:hypothetical protein
MGRTNDLQNTTQETYYIEETHDQAENPFIFETMLPDYPSYLNAGNWGLLPRAVVICLAPVPRERIMAVNSMTGTNEKQAHKFTL